MKEKTKKIILGLVVLASALGIVVTIIHAKNNTSSNDNTKIVEMIDRGAPPGFNNHSKVNKDASLATKYIVIVGVLSSTLSLSLLYLIMSIKNDKFYKNKDKVMVYILGNIVLITTLTLGTKVLSEKIILNNDNNVNQSASEKEKTTLDENNVVTTKNIDLDQYDNDLTIKESGTYNLTGSFDHSIIIDAEDEEVKLIFNDVTINSTSKAAIIGVSASKITISLNGKNTLADSGNSEYDSCIYSNAELVFEGDGTLIVNALQDEGEGIATKAANITFNNGTYIITSNDDAINTGDDGGTITFNDGAFYIDASGDGIDSNKDVVINGGTIFVMGSDVGGDAGIDTDAGFVINGGTVIAVGSDMIETPLDASKQKTIAFSLDDEVAANNLVTLMKDDEVIVSFVSTKSFKTLIISSNTIENGDYSLYVGGKNTGTLENGIYKNGKYTKGEKIKVNNADTFTVSKTVNLFGNKGMR